MRLRLRHQRDEGHPNYLEPITPGWQGRLLNSTYRYNAELLSQLSRVNLVAFQADCLLKTKRVIAWALGRWHTTLKRIKKKNFLGVESKEDAIGAANQADTFMPHSVLVSGYGMAVVGCHPR